MIAAYLRVWAPLLAEALYMASGAAAAAAGSVTLLALSAWSWTWRSRRGARATRRSDFDLVALGSRCDPAWMARPMRDSIERGLADRLSRRDDARPPEDVARFGAKDVDEALLAYGLLRLGASRHRDAAAGADRLLSSAFDELPSERGPYRERLAQSVPELSAAISAAAARQASARVRRPTRVRLYQRPGLQLAGLVWLSLTTWMFAGDYADQARAARAVGTRELAAVRPPSGPVSVRCERVQDDGWQVLRKDEVEQLVTFCWLGNRFLPVVSSASAPADASELQGTLADIPDHGGDHAPWADELHRDATLDAQAYAVYLRRDDGEDRRRRLVLAVGAGIGTVSGWAFWIAAFRRRRAARRGRSAAGDQPDR